jgi:transcriptional regulator with XRE-family HTH domain
MFEALGRLVRERREALGLEQAEVATELGIRQQAISGWERGRSRPRRAMLRDLARLLSVDESTLIGAGNYLPSKAPAKRPIRSLTRVLPLDELPEERFEDLIAEVMVAMQPYGHASRFGGRGHKQYGIDILVTGDGENLASGQCKRHKEFGPAAVRTAIAEVTVDANKHYLFLSRITATPGARKEAAKHQSWELWDGEDISRFIRDLPRDWAVRIVDTYFPGHREAFLGIASAGPWLLPEEHFDTARSMIFNHDWELTGRVDELNELERSAYRAIASLSIVTGHGGVGKTRLLKALADAAPNETVQIRILPGDTQITSVDYELLPREADLVVIIDDAHEFADVTPVVANIWRWNHDAKIVLATRPYGQRRLSENLERAGLLLDDRAEIELGDLTFKDAQKLAREALGDDIADPVVRRLARLTTDSPLATVVGGVLIKRGELDPSALEQDDTIRDQIMRGFRDALIRDPLVDDPPTRSAVLDALAAIQPFRVNETTARESLSEIVRKPYDFVHKHLRSLENAGILRRRGDSLRIVPDLLGDVILADAAYGDGDPLGTGYLARIEPLIVGASAEHLFVNVSRVDWQVHQRRAGAPSLADSLWSAFQERIQQSDLIDRPELVKLLAKVAYFQPERTLQVTRWITDHPTTEISKDHSIWSVLASPTYLDVLHELPPALKLAAMNFETLGEALTQLWELAQADERPTNPHPQHALRVLREIAEFDVSKPLAYNMAVIETVTTWFADDLRVSPFEVLEPMLATEGDDSSLRGHTITFRPFPFIPTSVMPVRQRVIDLAFEEIRSPNLRRAAAAVSLLKAALRYPSGTFGREVTREERDGWTPGIVETIQRLGALGASGSVDPAIHIGIRDALYWHENYSPTETRQAAESAVQGLPVGIDALLALTVHDGWGRLIRDRGDALETMEAKRLQLIQDVIAGLSPRTDDEVIELVIERLEADRAAYGPGEGHPGPMIAGLIQARPSLAQGFLQHIRSATAPTALEPLLPVVLATFADIDAPQALATAKELLAEGPEARRLSVVQALSWNRGARTLAAGELDLLLQLASDRNPQVRRGVARAAQILAHTHKIEASRLIAAIRFADDPQLADEIFMCFSEQLGLSWGNFSEQDLARIREDLVVLDDVNQYSITRALAKRSATDPEWVIRLLQDRVEHAERLESLDGYRAMPFSWDNPLRVRETTEFAAGLNGILTWIADNLDSWMRRDIGAEVFAAVASGYDKNVVGVLTSALATGSEEMTRAVAAVLREARRTFIWDEPDFVRTALHSANRLGDKMRREMSGALYGATISGVRFGTPGEPFREDIDQRDKSLEIAEQLPTGSIEHKFYSEMAKAAEESIARETEDEVSDDGRVW